MSTAILPPPPAGRPPPARARAREGVERRLTHFGAGGGGGLGRVPAGGGGGPAKGDGGAAGEQPERSGPARVPDGVRGHGETGPPGTPEVGHPAVQDRRNMVG